MNERLMPLRFICPHCHASVDPLAMERACSELAEYRVCPVCDEPVLVALRTVLPVPAPEGLGRPVRRTPVDDGGSSSRVLL